MKSFKVYIHLLWTFINNRLNSSTVFPTILCSFKKYLNSLGKCKMRQERQTLIESFKVSLTYHHQINCFTLKFTICGLHAFLDFDGR